MANGRKRLGEAVGGRLVQTDGPVEILQPLLAQVAQEDVEVLLLVLEQRLGGLGEEDLAAVAGRPDARRAVDRKARVPAVGRDRLPCVEPHPHPDRCAVGPLVGGKGELALDGGEQCVPRARERDEERVALRVDLVAVVGCEGLPQQALVIGEHLPVAVAELLDEPGRSLDVREQEGDRTRRKLGHEREPASQPGDRASAATPPVSPV